MNARVSSGPPTGAAIALAALALLWSVIPAATGAERPPSRTLPAGDGPWVVQAHFDHRDRLAVMAREHDVWQVDALAGYALVLVRDRDDYRRLLDLSVGITVDTHRSKEIEAVQGPGAKAGIAGYACYRTVDETLTTLRKLAQDHPDLAERIVIGESWDRRFGQGGSPLEVLRLTRRATGSKPALFITAALHGREYATAELATRFAEFLIQGYGEDATASWLLDHREIHLLLVTNPDGRRRAETGVLWRKNTNNDHCPGANPGQGVDLNRNFSFGWGQFAGSSGQECEQDYRGPGPGSEPETQAVSDYLQTLFRDYRPDDLATPSDPDAEGLYLDVHSFGRLVMWPWGFRSVPVPDAEALEQLGRRVAWHNRYRPQQELFLYATDGTATQFAYGSLGVATILFEVGDSFFENCALFEDVVTANLPALAYAARVADAPYRTPAGPDVTDLLVLPGIAAPGESILLGLAGDDGQISRLGGIAPIHGIAGFDIELESPEGVVISSRSIESGRETRAGLDVSGLDLGRYRVNARAIDRAGEIGPWYSAWLDLVDAESTGVFAGAVRSAWDNRPLPAVVAADEASGASDPESGDYRLRLPPGRHGLRATSPDHVAVELAPVELAATTIRPSTLRLEPLCEVFSEDAENGLPGWSGDWGTTDETAAQGQFSLTDSPGGFYRPGLNVMASPEFDLSDVRHAELVFSYRCNTEAQADFGRVQIRQGQGVPFTVFECSGDTGDWQTHRVDLDRFLGRSGLSLNVHLFADAATEDDGIYLDDIRVLAQLAGECPGRPTPEFVFSGDLSGTWYDPSATGQGFVVEVAGGNPQPVLVITWYTYESGEPLWLIGSTPITFDQSEAVVPLFRASGTGFGADFDPQAVEIQHWGEVTVAFSALERGSIDYRRDDGASGTFDLIRLTAGLGELAAPGLSGISSGAWYEPDRPGQGITVELARNNSGPVAIATWYTHLEGRPVWLIGSAGFEAADDVVQLEMMAFRGTGFGADFDAGEVVGETWGLLELAFESCGKLRVQYEFEQGAGELELQRLTGGLLDLACHSP